jgi:hypothetical protein
LLTVLSTTKEFLLRSKYERWPDEKPNDTALGGKIGDVHENMN